jgi:hypothetical protein
MVAQVSIGVLLLVIIRSLGEYFRLQYLYGDALVIGQVTPYVAGALFAAVALAVMATSYFAGLYRIPIALAAATVEPRWRQRKAAASPRRARRLAAVHESACGTFWDLGRNPTWVRKAIQTGH